MSVALHRSISGDCNAHKHDNGCRFGVLGYLVGRGYFDLTAGSITCCMDVRKMLAVHKSEKGRFA